MTPRHGWLAIADLNPGAGTEAGKRRPVLILQVDLLNDVGHPSTWVLPCTTRLTGESLLREPIAAGVAGNADSCEIMVDQPRAIDNRRFRELLGPLPGEILTAVKDKVRLLGGM